MRPVSRNVSHDDKRRTSAGYVSCSLNVSLRVFGGNEIRAVLCCTLRVMLGMVSCLEDLESCSYVDAIVSCALSLLECGCEFSTVTGLVYCHRWEDLQVEFKRISLTGFRSCTSRSRYRSVLKQTTWIFIIIVNTVRYHSDVLAISQG
ncbi:hypothetical protein Tco_0809530 [Tanacetum coccineum]